MTRARPERGRRGSPAGSPRAGRVCTGGTGRCTRRGEANLQQTGSAALDPTERPLDEASAFAWLRHYTVVLVVALLAGGAVGGLITVIRPPSAEAWTYVLQTPYRLPRGQLGLMAKAIFVSPVVYTAARVELPTPNSEQEFRESVEVRPVPQTNTLIVVGRASDATRASQLSASAARGLIVAFADSGVPEFQILGTGPAAVPSAVSDRVIVIATIVVALLAGVVVALVHFGVARPILSLERAVALTRPTRLVEVRRPPLPLRLIRRTVPVPHATEGEAAVLVARPATTERSLLAGRLSAGWDVDLTLVWAQ